MYNLATYLTLNKTLSVTVDKIIYLSTIKFCIFSEIIYSWVFNELPSFVAEDSRRFISQETGNLYISKVQTSDVGSYICLVKNTVTNARVLSPPTPLTLRNDGKLPDLDLMVSYFKCEKMSIVCKNSESLGCISEINTIL